MASRVQLSSLPNGLALIGGTFAPAVGATARVYQHGTTSEVTVFAAETGSGLANPSGDGFGQPVIADSNGLFSGWVAGEVDVDIVATYLGTTASPALGVPLRSPDIAVLASPNTFASAQTLNGGIIFGASGLGSGLAMNDSPTFDAGGAAGFLARFQTSLAARNGINARAGAVGDSITSDNSNGAGSTFFANDYRLLQVGGVGAANSKGSGQIYTAQGTITDTGDGGAPKYRELGLYEATLTADSKGAYGALLEGGATITSGKPSRTNGVAILINESNALSSYAAAVGATSIYADTGARAFAAQNVGSSPTGTAYHVYGDFVRGLLCTFFNQANNVLESRAQNNANPLVQMNGLGTISWGAGGASAPDITLSRGAAAILSLAGSLQIAGTSNLLLAGGVLSFNGNAQASYTTATAGTNGAPPAQVAGYVLIVDSAGTNRKVPYYAV